MSSPKTGSEMEDLSGFWGFKIDGWELATEISSTSYVS
jgi:hypothetical protein